jgi:hypothetical protein
MKDIDAAVNRWKEANPLTEESTRLLIDLREAGLTDQPQDLLWAAFVRSLTDDRQEAAVALIELANDGEGFRFF